MFKIRVILTTFLIVMCFSCQDLDEQARGSLVSDSFFQSKADLDAAVVAVYSELVDNAWSGFPHTSRWAPLMGGDTIAPNPARTGWAQFEQFAVEAQNGTLQTLWSQFYGVIYAANNVTENYESVEGNEEAIMQSVAQARFLRAFAYFWLVRMFGDIPMPTTTLDQDIERSPVEDVYAQIESDLTFAEQHLPETWQDQPARPTVWAAKSLLAQVYLMMAGWPLNDNSKYAQAAQKAEDVIDNSPHNLLEDYGDLWLMANEMNDETIWSVYFCRLVDCGTNARTSVTATSTGPSEEGGWNELYFEINFFNEFPEGPRKEATFHTVFTDGTHWQNSVIGNPFIAKYRDGSVPGSSNFESQYLTGRNLQYLRFAEILLIYAEATAMSSGPNAKAYEAINKVRRRAQGDPIDQPSSADLQTGLSAEQFRDSVLVERKWEFAAEYSRWFDLVRTQRVAEANGDKHPDDLKPIGDISTQDYIFPIPQREIQLNPNLSQNEGY